jgi:hypothetical protein
VCERERRALGQDAVEFGQRLGQAPLVHVNRVCVVTAQFRRRSDERHCAFIRAQERRQHLVPRLRPERRHQEVAIALSLESAVIARRFRRGFLKAFERALEALTRSQTEKMIAVTLRMRRTSAIVTCTV